MIQPHSSSESANAPPMNARVQFCGVSKSFGSTLVLDRLDWSIESGSVVGLLGLNGSGKSTLLRCMLGLLKVDTGEIRIDGEDAWDLSDETKARLSFVDQHPRLFPWMSGSQLLQHIGSMYPRWNEQLVCDVAKEWDVPLEKRFGALSPGQQQKVAILSALGNEPDLLVLDEPVSSLDPLARRSFLRSLLAITQDADRTVLLSTHITSDLERVASHIAVLNEGQIRWFDELDELKDRVKRLRLRSRSATLSGNLPDNMTVPNSIRLTVTGKTATAVVGNWSEETHQKLSQDYDVDVQVEDLNLEDIFLEVHDSESR